MTATDASDTGPLDEGMVLSPTSLPPAETSHRFRRLRRAAHSTVDHVAHGRVSWLVVGVICATAAAFLPIVGLLVLVTLIGVSAVVGGRPPVVMSGMHAFALLAIAPRYTFGPFAVTVATLLGLASLLMWLAGVLIPSRSSLVRPRSPVGTAILLMGFAFLMSYAVGMSRVLLPGELPAADKAMIYLASGLGITLLLSEGVGTRRGLDRVMGAFLVGSAVLATASIFQFVFDFDLTSLLRPPGFTVSAPTSVEGAERLGLDRVRGTVSHPIEAGAIAATALPLALHYTAYARTSLSRFLSGALSLALVAALLMSISRSALLGLGVALLVMLPMWSTTQRFRFYLGAISVVIAGIIFVPELLDAAATIATDWRGDTIDGAGIEGRTEDYDVARQFFVDRPLFGIGYGTYNSATYFAFDNQFLNTLAESGLVGFLGLVGVCAVAVVGVVRSRRRTTDAEMKNLATAVLASLAVVIVSMATYDALSFLSATGVFYLILGFAGVVWRLSRDDRAVPVPAVLPVAGLGPVVPPAQAPAPAPLAPPILAANANSDRLATAATAAASPSADPATAGTTETATGTATVGNPEAATGTATAGTTDAATGTATADPRPQGDGPDQPTGPDVAAPLDGGENSDRVGAVVSGTRWGAVAQLVTQAARLIVSFVLARLLLPEHYGVVIFGLTVLQFLDILKDLGTAPAIIQRKEINDRLLSSLFYVNVAIGVVLALGFTAMSPWLARIAGDPDASTLLALLSLGLLMSSVGMVNQGLLRRRFMFGRIALMNMAQAVVNGVVAVTTAYMGAEAWSLVYGQISGVAVSVTIGWISTRWRPRLLFDRQEVRSVASFSAGITGFNLFAFFFHNADKVLVGAYLGPAALGYYGLGQRILMYPVRSVTQMIQQVLFPAFSRVQDDDGAMRRGYLRAAAAISLVTFPMMAGFTVVADPFVRGLLPPRWEPAITLMTILAPVGLLHSMSFTVGAIYQAKGRADLLFRWGVISGVTTVIAYVAGLPFGVNGVATTYAIAVILLTYPAFALPFRLIDLPVIDLFRAVRPYLFASLAMAGLVFGNRLILESQGMSPRTVLVVCVVVGSAFYAAWLWAARPPAVEEVLRIVGRRRKQPEAV